MSADRFADAARTLAGIAARMLGWRPYEFWAATPDELAAALTVPGDPVALPPEPQAIAALRSLFPDTPETFDG
ncbi:phage tail assembly chaperone [Blastomonas sp. AAP53]|uniref:phage tail assembly chaperone n=1 Tax=Blastomonas sp. AAP53 TaxID=1248760 RepID=UPI0002E3793F|nr:phage tail assembly chaperone [Blastomonas sp. AAP53]